MTQEQKVIRAKVGVLELAKHQMVGSSLAGGIGRVRRIGGCFCEKTFIAKRAEHFVGGNMQEAKLLALCGRQHAPRAQGFLQQCEAADGIGPHEFARTIDRAIDMAFGRQIHHRVRLVFLE